jgi:hypothetical protein
MTSGGGGSSSSSSSPSPAPRDPVDIAKDAVRLKDFTWSKGGFENIMIANFIVDNTGDRAVKDLEFTCVHSAKSGTAQSSRCSITDLKVI